MTLSIAYYMSRSFTKYGTDLKSLIDALRKERGHILSNKYFEASLYDWWRKEKVRTQDVVTEGNIKEYKLENTPLPPTSAKSKNKKPKQQTEEDIKFDFSYFWTLLSLEKAKIESKIESEIEAEIVVEIVE